MCDFIRWRSPAEIANTYHLKDRSTVYRHAQALNLYPKRQRNIRAALERIIEKAGEVEVTAAVVVAAVQAYAKINAAGQWIERTETVNLHELFERMTQDELEAYARDGKLRGLVHDLGEPTGISQEHLPGRVFVLPSSVFPFGRNGWPAVLRNLGHTPGRRCHSPAHRFWPVPVVATV